MSLCPTQQPVNTYMDYMLTRTQNVKTSSYFFIKIINLKTKEEGHIAEAEI